MWTVAGTGVWVGSACETGSHPDAVSGSGIIQPGHINTEAVSQLGSVRMHHDHPVVRVPARGTNEPQRPVAALLALSLARSLAASENTQREKNSIDCGVASAKCSCCGRSITFP